MCHEFLLIDLRHFATCAERGFQCGGYEGG